MKNWVKKNGINVLIAGIIAIPISIYAISQQRQPVVNVNTEVVESQTDTEEATEESSEVTVEPLDNTTVAEPETEQTKEPTYISLGEFKLTAYCSCEECCGRWAVDRPVDEYGNEVVIGSQGTVLEPLRSIAVDTSVIPYGTEIMIYDRVFIAQDTGKSIVGNCIDVYMSQHWETEAFGVQYAEVYMVKGGEDDGQ